MASNESAGNVSAQPNLHTQDLSTLNVATLTPLSPEVISRQATINIGTIGHVAHGKSTVVKAISGVQTVRFKNELERNITIKLERLQFGADGKVVQPKSQLKSNCAPSLRGSGSAQQRSQPVVLLERLNGLHMYSSAPLGTKRKRTSSSTDRSLNPSKKLNRDTGRLRKGSDVSDMCKREYVVERILAYEVRKSKSMFLVKWQGWSEKYNSWEPFEHLTHCERVLQNFLADSLQEKVLNELRGWLDMAQVTVSELDQYIGKRGGVRALPNRTRLQRELLGIATVPLGKRTDAMRERCRHTLMQYLGHVHRDRQLASLRDWEEQMNATAQGHALLTVENDVDLEAAPAGFVYVNSYVAGDGVLIPDDPPIGCECEQCGPRSAQCCASQTKFAYNSRDRLRVPQGTPIYECNRRCRCKPATCRNRLIQAGRRVPLCIFRTADGRGWGVRTLRKVYAGEFVCEYVGEVISFEEAERRGLRYDAEGRTYLFDLDFNSNDFPYTVDAATYGNESHFINHSCAPNLGVWAVWVNCLDPNLPRLALFATREIVKGEEITFDYMCNVVRAALNDGVFGTPTRSRLEVAKEDDERPQCKCAANTCRRYLF